MNRQHPRKIKIQENLKGTPKSVNDVEENVDELRLYGSMKEFLASLQWQQIPIKTLGTSLSSSLIPRTHGKQLGQSITQVQCIILVAK